MPVFSKAILRGIAQERKVNEIAVTDIGKIMLKHKRTYSPDPLLQKDLARDAAISMMKTSKAAGVMYKIATPANAVIDQALGARVKRIARHFDVAKGDKQGVGANMLMARTLDQAHAVSSFTPHAREVSNELIGGSQVYFPRVLNNWIANITNYTRPSTKALKDFK
jgi:hypothetical protein